MSAEHKRIGEILIEKGLITEAQLHDALMEQKLNSKFLGQILVSKNLISNDDLIETLAFQFGIPLVDIKRQYINMELARKFSSSLILDHKCFPLKDDELSVTVAIINPLDALAISKIEEACMPRAAKFVLVKEDDLKDVLVSFRQYINKSIQNMLRKDKSPNE
jgi:type IV pilus assembly protein PilB